MKYYIAFASICLASLIPGCNTGPKSSRGFTLPDGDVERGKTAFVELQCDACHSVRGANLPTPDETPELSVTLGGEVARIKSYGELVTSIINPSHRLAKGYAPEDIQTNEQSNMKNYNDVLTVSQLIDLVAFLQSHYELEEYDQTDYPVYP
jgi:hypothetical protein